jgi:hypothetical protein
MIRGTTAIVTENLVLCVDAANLKSYPRTGNVWYDNSGLANNGTLANSPTFTASSLGEISLNGTTQYAAFGNKFNYTNDITLCSWVYLTSYAAASGHRTIMTKAEGGAYYLSVQTSAGGGNAYLSWQGYIGGAYRILTGTTPVSLNRWYFVTATYDGSNFKLYLNGTLDGTLAYSGNLTTTTQPFCIGVNPNVSTYSDYFAGKIAHASVYDRALTFIEISQNYNATRTRFGIS